MLPDHAPLRILDTPSLGDPLFALPAPMGGLGGVPADRYTPEPIPAPQASLPIPPMSPVPWKEAYAALEARVAALEARTLSARLHRLRAWLRSAWERLWH